MAIMKYHKHYNDLDSLLDSVFSGVKIPAVDIREDKENYTINAEIPGFDEKDISVFVEKHVLTIEGKKEEEKVDDRKYLVKERAVRNFSRSFTLPDDLDEEKVSASFKNGVLEITLPKTEKAQPKRIEVKVGANGEN